jgi:hypothetical protein
MIVVLRLSIDLILEKNGGHPHPLNLLALLSLTQLVVLKSHVLSKNAATFQCRFLCMLKYTKLLQSFSSNRNPKRIWKMDLKWCWICNSKMWSVVSPFCLDFYNKCFLSLNFSISLMN